MHELHLVVVELDVDGGPGPDRDGAEGLGDVVHRAQGQALLLVLYIRQAADQDDGRVFGENRLLEPFQQSEAVYVRHDDVQENQGEIFPLRLAEALLALQAYGDLVVIAQNGFQIFSLCPAVFDYQYFIHVFPCSLHVTSAAGAAGSP